MKSQEEKLFELQAIATTALGSFQVWWALVNKIHPTYGTTIRLYSDFFQVTRTATFRTFLLELGRLLDTRKDSVSLKTYFSEYPPADQEISTEYAAFKTRNDALIKAVRKLRHQAIAHQDWNQSSQEVFSEVGLTPNELSRLLEELVGLVRKTISHTGSGAGNITETRRYENETIAVVSHITEWNKLSPKDNGKIWLVPPKHKMEPLDRPD